MRRPHEPAQCLAIRYSEPFADAGVCRPFGRQRWDSYDNALAETVNGLYKTELSRAHGPRRTADQVELASAAWVAWWNAKRLHGTRVDIPPAEFEAAYHQRLQATTAAACNPITRVSTVRSQSGSCL